MHRFLTLEHELGVRVDSAMSSAELDIPTNHLDRALEHHPHYVWTPALAHARTIGRLRHPLAELRQEALARTLVGLPADPDLDALILMVEAELDGMGGA